MTAIFGYFGGDFMTGQEEFSGKFRRWQNSPAGEAYMKVSLLNEPSRRRCAAGTEITEVTALYLPFVG